jgi:hypothetical protein
MSVIRGVLLAGKFRSQEELNGMSRDDQRNTLIVELVNHSNQPVGHFQGLDDAAVAGAGALMVFLRETRARTDDELRRMSDDDQRNTAIVILNAQTGIPGPRLQGMSNLELVHEVLGIDVDVFGAIGDKWRELGGLKSFLGPPTSDELDFDEGGKVRSFLGGAVYFWGDTGAMAVPNNTIAVRYSGLNCFGTTDGPGDDEPYFIFAVVAPGFKATPRTRIFEGVSAGSNVPDSLDLFRGAPLGIAIDVTLMEHDTEDPNKYRSLVERAVNEAVPRVTEVLTLVPAIGQVLSIGARVALELLHGDIVDALNGLLGTDDDRLGQQLIQLTPKKMIVLATQTPISDLGGVRFRLQTGLFDGAGSSYKACFDIAPA